MNKVNIIVNTFMKMNCDLNSLEIYKTLMSDNWIIFNISMFIDRSYLTGISQCPFEARFTRNH